MAKQVSNYPTAQPSQAKHKHSIATMNRLTWMLRALLAASMAATAHTASLEVIQGTAGADAELVLREDDDAAHAETTYVKYPKMPALLESLLHEDWKALGVADILEQLKSPGVMEFAHGRDTFYSHLQGTYGILRAWNQPTDVCLLGMTHTAYGGDLFQFFLWDSMDNREGLRDLIGAEAEGLTFLFGTIHRGMLGDLQGVMANATDMAPLRGDTVVTHRTDGTVSVPAATAAKILLATVADYLDQMVEQNGWRDHHQVDVSVDRLYPGDGRPTLAFYWFSQVCRAVREHLEVVPPIFDSCTTVISKADEIAARDLYWKVTLSEYELSEAEQRELLYRAIEHNPFVGEPHILLAQLYYRNGEYRTAAEHCRQALQKLYVLASAWDKRRSFRQWVGFSRVLMMRSNRHLQGLPHLPYYDMDDPSYISAKGLHLTSLHEMAREMKAYEEE